jgi:hypothetical protein
MPLTLHVEAESYDQLVKQCWASLGLQLQNQKPVPTETAKVAEPNGTVEAKKPVGRPKKTETPVDVPPTTPVDTPPKSITLEQVRAGLQTYADKMAGGKEGNIGIMKAREVLAKFTSIKGTPCQKISEVQDKDYPAVLAECAA